MFVSLRKLVININKIEIIEDVNRDTCMHSVTVYMVSGLEIGLSIEDAKELFDFMDKHEMVKRSHE